MDNHLEALAKDFRSYIEHLQKEGKGKETDFKSFYNDFSSLVKKLQGNSDRQNSFFEQDVQKHLKLKNFSDSYSLSKMIERYAMCKAYAYHLYEFIKQDRFVIESKKNYSHYINKVEQEEWDTFETGVNQTSEVPWEVCFFMKEKETNLKFVLRVGFQEDKFTFYCDKQDKEKILKINKEFEKFFKENNVYRNKRVEFSSHGLHFIEDSKTTFEDVVLRPEIKKEIDENILGIFEKAKIYKKNGIPLKRGVIFSGPPGCGKSLTVNALSSCLKDKVTFIVVTPKSVRDTDDISLIYNFARMLAPSLIVFEDIDLLGGDRSSGEFSPYVGELLSQLDGLVVNDQIVTIASTNHPERLDEALKNRPSRFDRNLTFDLPDNDLKIKLLKKYLENYEYDEKNINFNSIAHELQEVSGAQVKEVVISSVLYAMNESQKDAKKIVLGQKDLEMGINKSKNKFFKDKTKAIGFQ